MAVHYAGGGDSFFGRLAQAASFIPGVGPWVGAANALMGGNPLGAAASFLPGIGGKAASAAGSMSDAVAPAETTVNPQLENGLWAAHRQNGNPIPGNDVYVNMRMAQPPVVQPNESFMGALNRAHRGRFPDYQSDPVTGRRY